MKRFFHPLCIVQARMGSTRLPGKVLREVNGIPFLLFEIERLRRSARIEKIVVATGEGNDNDPIEALALRAGVASFRGSESDVLSRYARCSDAYPEFDPIVRITGDCPLIDPKVVDRVITFFEEGEFEYASNVDPPTFPDGMDAEVFRKEALFAADREARRPSEREHVTLFIRESGRFKTGTLRNNVDYSSVRLTLDAKEDLEVLSFLIERCPPDAPFEAYVKVLCEYPEIAAKNQYLERNFWLKKLRDEELT